MKTLFRILLLALLPLTVRGATNANVRFDLGYFTSEAVSYRPFLIVPTNTPTVFGSKIIVNDSKQGQLDVNGQVTITNMAPTDYYFFCPWPKPTTVFKITVPTTNGTLFAENLISVSTNLATAINAYSMASMDSILAGYVPRSGSNQVSGYAGLNSSGKISSSVVPYALNISDINSTNQLSWGQLEIDDLTGSYVNRFWQRNDGLFFWNGVTGDNWLTYTQSTRILELSASTRIAGNTNTILGLMDPNRFVPHPARRRWALYMPGSSTSYIAIGAPAPTATGVISALPDGTTGLSMMHTNNGVAFDSSQMREAGMYWRTGRNLYWESEITIYNTNQNTLINFGWCNSASRVTTNNPTGINGAWVRASATAPDANFKLVCNNNTGAQTEVDTGIAITGNPCSHKWGCQMNDSGGASNVVLWCDGAVVATATSNLPSTGINMLWFQDFKTLDAFAKSNRNEFVYIESDR